MSSQSTEPVPLRDPVPRRPSERIVRIDDCRSARLFDNPTEQCPHGKAWRESDYDTLPTQVKKLMCPAQGCQATEYHPHAGEHITLRVPRSFAARRPINELLGSMRTLPSGEVASALTEAERNAQIREIVVEGVVDWSWTGRSGKLLPTPAQDWDALGPELELSELWWIIRAINMGRDPYEAERAAGN